MNRKPKRGRKPIAQARRRPTLTCTIAPETMVELNRIVKEQQSNLGRVIDALVSDFARTLERELATAKTELRECATELEVFHEDYHRGVSACRRDTCVTWKRITNAKAILAQ